MHKIEKLNENTSFSDAIRLVIRIKEDKLTLGLLGEEASAGLILLIKDKLGWIDAPDEDSWMEITVKVKEYVIEYRAMIVLENIKSRTAVGCDKKTMTKFELTNNASAGIVDSLEINKPILLADIGLGYPDDKIVHATDKRAEELKEYFKKEE